MHDMQSKQDTSIKNAIPLFVGPPFFTCQGSHYLTQGKEEFGYPHEARIERKLENTYNGLRR